MNFKKLRYHILVSAASLMFAAGMSSCDVIYEEGGDGCDVHHIMRFKYDMNLKWANAFPAEVKSVNLYAFDSNGVFVKEYMRSGSALADPSFGIDLDLPAGDYKFLAWCGLENQGATEESFSLTQPEIGVTTIDEMICSLNTQKVGVYSQDEGVYSTRELYFLYWDYIEETLIDNNDGSTYEYLMSLTKDTNHIRIILQELSGDNLNPSDFEFTIDDANGLISWDNSMLGDTMITYEPWSQINDEVGVGKIDVLDGGLTYVKGIVADMSTSRLMASMQNNVMLTITNAETKEVVARIPVIQYFLLAKGYYERAYGHMMTDQEFLDREDEYSMTLFLINGRWLDAYIDIQSWRIVLHDYEVGGGR